MLDHVRVVCEGRKSARINNHVAGTISSVKSNRVISDIQKTKSICRFIIVFISLLLIKKKILDKLEELLSGRFGVEGHFADASHCKLCEKCFTNRGLGLSLLLSLTFILPVTSHPTPMVMTLINSWTIRTSITRFEFLSSSPMFFLLRFSQQTNAWQESKTGFLAIFR